MVARPRVGLQGVLTLALVGVMVAALAHLANDDSPDPEQLLADSRRAVEDANSFRFTIRTQLDIDDSEAGRSVAPRRMSTEGSWSAGRSYTRHAGVFGGDEAIVDGEAAYHRYLGSADDEAEPVWTMTETDRITDEGLAGELHQRGLGLDDDDMAFVADQTAVEVAAWIYMGGTDASIATMSMTTGGYIGIDASIFGGFSGAPTGFLEAIAELGHPDVAYDGNGGSTLVATLRAPEDLGDAFGHPIPDGTVELAVGPDHLPSALRVRIDQDAVRSLTEVEFTGWNEPVDIRVPTGEQVDTTPWLDEDGLRQLTRITFLAPAALPEGWGLMVSSTDDSGTFDTGYDECLGVQLDWYKQDGPGNDDSDFLSTLLIPVDCALAENSTPFQPGGPGGFPSRIDPELPGVEVLVGDMAVAFGSNFPSAEQDALIASLAPVDVEALIAVASAPPPGE